MEIIQICASLPLLSLVEDTARLNPLQSISPMARKTNLLAEAKSIDVREIQSYLNHAQKSPEKTQIIFIDNPIINLQFIGSQQTHTKEDYIE